MCPSTKEVVVAHPRIGVRLRAAPAPPPDAPQHQQQQQQHHQQHHHQQHQQQSRESGASAAAVSNDATGGWLSCRPAAIRWKLIVTLLCAPALPHSSGTARWKTELPRSLASRILPAAYVGPVEGDDNKLRGSLDVDGLVDCVLAENQIASLMAKLEVELNAIQQAKEQTIAKKDQELAAVKARTAELEELKKKLQKTEEATSTLKSKSDELQEACLKIKELEEVESALKTRTSELEKVKKKLHESKEHQSRLKELELDVESHSKKIQQEVERATRKARKEQEDKMDDMERKLADLQDVEQNGRKELDRLQRALQSQKRALAETLYGQTMSLSAAEEPEKGGVPPRVLRATQPAKPPMKPKERPERRKPPIVQKKDQDQDDEVIPDSTKIPDTQADDQPATTSNEEAPSEVEESEPMAVRPADEDDIDDDSDENTKRERVRGRAELKGSSKPAKTEAKGSKRQAAPRKKKEDGKAGKKLKPTPPPEEAAANASLQAAASTSAAAAAASKPQFSFSSALLAAAPPFLGNATTSNPFLLATAPNLDAVSSFGSTLRAGKKRLNALMAGKEDQ
ncbi:hypothetical protein DFJ73DRAFT_773789 [Zopfochytrium polystomum]|nr:hypothetical protein DFJ73DRAFT_773789 [Zopfochytrium polystomum]